MRRAALLTLLLGACTQTPASVGSARQLATAADPYVYDLVLGSDSVPVGTVAVWNTDDNLRLKVALAAGHDATSVHLCVAENSFPWTPPGQCAYKREGLPHVSTVELTVPLIDIGEDLCDRTIHLQLQADVDGTGGGYAGTFKGSVAYTVGCDQPSAAEGCTRSHGYWKHHDWPVSSFMIGGTTYDREALMELLTAPTRGDASIILARQLVAALLNLASGASSTGDVTQALDAADAWAAEVGPLPAGLWAAEGGADNAPAFDQAVSVGAILDAYNRGEVGPGSCEDEVNAP